MSIDLSCFSNLATDLMQQLLSDFVSRRSEIFPSKYYASDVSDLDEIDKEIASDFGMKDACCSFLLMLNDKSLSLGTQAMADIMYKEFGKDKIIVLFATDFLMQPTPE
jgi:hypothetical protein